MKSEGFINMKKRTPFDLNASIQKWLTSMKSKEFNYSAISSLISQLKQDIAKWDELSQRVFYRRLEELQGPLLLYSNGFYSNAIVDLYGFLERTMINMLPDLLPTFKGRREVIENLLIYQNLDDLARSFLLLGILDKNDSKKIEKLKKFRDAIAHKNIRKISDVISKNERSISYFAIDNSINQSDVKTIIIDSFKLYVKLFEGYEKLFPRNHIAQAILDNKILYPSECGILFDV